ncbi:MAG TPA: M1 family aminopeptidase, partial [Gemmatimonadales bacterium]|nr:M1 family aminopeptidase [Gemmatimonadales bacterium]
VSPNPAAWRFEHPGDTLVVHLPQPVGFGDTVRFTVDYHARIDNGRGLTYIEADSVPSPRPRQIWSQGEDHNNHFWFPTYDFPNDKATWELIATVPRGFTAVSNGRLVSERAGPGGGRTFTWSQEQPSATYLVSLIVAPLTRLTDRWRGVPLDYYVYHQDSAAARPLFRVTPDMIEVYSRLTGLDYPWAKYAQTTVADFFGGMENVSATTLVDWLPDARAYADRPWYRYILIPHELAHQWFGDYVTTANWANMWLNEGFAEFMPGQYWADRLGRHAGEDYYVDEYRQYMQIERRRSMPLASLASNNIYPKGALVLEMLQTYLGPQAFWAGVHRYLEDHALGNATSDDLRQAFLEATGENLDWFWNQWVYQAGYPKFAVSAAWDERDTLTLTVRQTQVDSATADSTGLRFTTPEVFRMPVTIRVGTEAGDRTTRVWLDQREQVVRIPGVRTRPTMVIFDDGNGILKSLQFDEPTAWLTTQLARDPNLWNREWAIAQLGTRHDDRDAERALAAATTSADYFLTRVQAIDALSQFGTPGAQQALLAALSDTSAQVRAAAARGLADFPGPEVQAAVRRVWDRDTSYDARGAALSSLVVLDSAGAHGLIETGLHTPSYRDAIANSALGAVARSNDTTMLGEVDRAFGRLQAAAFVLAALGNRGSDRALRLLDGHVYDPNRGLRQQALRAYRFAMAP